MHKKKASKSGNLSKTLTKTSSKTPRKRIEMKSESSNLVNEKQLKMFEKTYNIRKKQRK